MGFPQSRRGAKSNEQDVQYGNAAVSCYLNVLFTLASIKPFNMLTNLLNLEATLHTLNHSRSCEMRF